MAGSRWSGVDLEWTRWVRVSPLPGSSETQVPRRALQKVRIAAHRYSVVSPTARTCGWRSAPSIVRDGSFVVLHQNSDPHLSVDEVAGGALRLHGDSGEVGFRERFLVKIRYKYKQEAHAEWRKKKEGIVGDAKIDEANTEQVAI